MLTAAVHLLRRHHRVCRALVGIFLLTHRLDRRLQYAFRSSKCHLQRNHHGHQRATDFFVQVVLLRLKH